MPPHGTNHIVWYKYVSDSIIIIIIISIQHFCFFAKNVVHMGEMRNSYKNLVINPAEKRVARLDSSNQVWSIGRLF
jgi:hypothetical protein